MSYETLLPNSDHEDLQNTDPMELSQMLKNFQPTHPALNRVRAKLVAFEKTESAITSYDRMHHRHNRS